MPELAASFSCHADQAVLCKGQRQGTGTEQRGVLDFIGSLALTTRTNKCILATEQHMQVVLEKKNSVLADRGFLTISSFHLGRYCHPKEATSKANVTGSAKGYFKVRATFSHIYSCN